MKRFAVKTRAGQLTWLQLLCLALSGVGYMLESMVMTVIMVLLGSLFGVGAMLVRVREAKAVLRQQPRRRR